MDIKHNNNLPKSIMFFLGFVATFSVIEILGQQIVILAMLITILVIIILKKPKITFSKFEISYICILFAGYIASLVYGVKYSHVVFISIIISLITFLLISIIRNESNDFIFSFIKGIKFSCIFQVIWCIAQYIFYNIWKIDINEEIFVNLFNIVQSGEASRYRNGTMVITGLSQHPANLIPIIIILYFLVDRWYVKVLCVLIALGTKNSTAIFTVLLCLGISFLRTFQKRITLKGILKTGIIVIILVGVLFIRNDLLEIIVSNIKLLYSRMFDISYEYGAAASSYVHKRYYTALFEVWKNTDIFRILFGYGSSCSGYPFTLLYGQYSNLLSWNVESNPMNAVYGTGIIGAAVYYFWFINTGVKGYKIDSRYTHIFFVLFISGILYDNQFTWVFLTELIIGICIKRKINIFVSLKD